MLKHILGTACACLHLRAPMILMDFERIAFQEQTEHLPQCIAGALGLGGFPSSSEFVQRGLAFFGGGRVDHLGPRLDPQPFGQQRLPQRHSWLRF